MLFRQFLDLNRVMGVTSMWTAVLLHSEVER
jgi:hypothetical protein